MTSDSDRQVAMGLLVLRFFLGIFLLQWSIEKLILPSATESIARGFYDVTLPAGTPMGLGIAELVLSLGLLFGGFRTISYGLSLLVHTVTVAVSWRAATCLTSLQEAIPGAPRRSRVRISSSENPSSRERRMKASMRVSVGP